MSRNMKVIGTGGSREVIHECAWCGEFIHPQEGDDYTTHSDGYYHMSCFEEAFYEKEEED